MTRYTEVLLIACLVLLVGLFGFLMGITGASVTPKTSVVFGTLHLMLAGWAFGLWMAPRGKR